MKIKFFRSLWGMQLPTIAENIAQTKKAGFDGIEYIALPDAAERKAFGECLKEHGLDFILQIGTGAGTGPAIGTESLQAHKDSLVKEVELGLELSPLFINSHTGRDIFTTSQNVELLQLSQKLAMLHGISIVHETHRGRATSTIPNTLKLAERVDTLKLTADFSHWTCAHESLLEDQVSALESLLSRVSHIHARVGDAQSPQVLDPRDGTSTAALEAHLDWWKQIVEQQKNKGANELTITVEFGPKPYQLGEADLGKLWNMNCWMKDYLKQHLRA